MASPWMHAQSFTLGHGNAKANLFGQHSQSFGSLPIEAMGGSRMSPGQSPYLASQIPTSASPMLAPQRSMQMQMVPVHEAPLQSSSMPLPMIQPSQGYYVSNSPMQTPQIMGSPPPQIVASPQNSLQNSLVLSKNQPPRQPSAWTVLEHGVIDGGAWSVMEAPAPPKDLIPITPSQGAFPLRRPPNAGTPHPVQKGSTTLQELREIFNTLDINHDGKVTHAEFIKGLKKNPTIAATLHLPQNVAHSQSSRDLYTREFNEMDTEGNKELSFDEMVRHYAPWAMAPLNSPNAPKLIGGSGDASPRSTTSEPKKVIQKEQAAAVKRAAPPPPGLNLATKNLSDSREVATVRSDSREVATVRTPGSMATIGSPMSAAGASLPTITRPLDISRRVTDGAGLQPARTATMTPGQSVGSLRAASPPRQVASQSRPVSSPGQLATYSESLPADGNQAYDRRPESVIRRRGSINGTMRVVSDPQYILAETSYKGSRITAVRESTGSRSLSAWERSQAVLRKAGFMRTSLRTEGELHAYDGSSSQWKRRKFVLESGSLSYMQEGSAERGSHGAAQKIDIFSSATLEVLHESHFNRPHCFILQNKDDGDVYLLSSTTPEERTAWVEALEQDAGVTHIVQGTDDFLQHTLAMIFGNVSA